MLDFDQHYLIFNENCFCYKYITKIVRQFWALQALERMCSWAVFRRLLLLDVSKFLP